MAGGGERIAVIAVIADIARDLKKPKTSPLISRDETDQRKLTGGGGCGTRFLLFHSIASCGFRDRLIAGAMTSA
jgi:hypothetical protein